MKILKITLLSILAAACLSVQLLPRPMNLEFTSVIVFVAGMVFGVLFGALLGTSVMFVNGFLSPYGFAGIILPFQIIGMTSIGVAGGLYSKMAKFSLSKGGFIETAILGAFLTFIYDVVTNVGTAVSISGLPFPQALILVLITGAVPSVIHVGWNTVLFGGLVAPLVNAMHKMLGRAL
jgi:hypothetical protein